MNEVTTEFDSDSGLFDMSGEFPAEDSTDLGSDSSAGNKKIDAKRRLEQYLEEKALRDLLNDDY